MINVLQFYNCSLFRMLSIVLLTFIFFLILFKLFRRKNEIRFHDLKELPSAPGGFPIIGHLLKLGPRPYEYLTNISVNLGPIYKIQIGWKEIVVLNNYDVLNKCFQEDGSNFAGRWKNVFSEQLPKYCGLALKEKEWWSIQRHFTLKVLKDFGFGKSQTEKAVTKETEKIIEIIRSSNKNAISTPTLLALATINVISDFIMHKEFKETDINIINLYRNIKRAVQGSDVNAMIISLFPVLKSFPKLEYKFYRLLDRSNIPNAIEDVHNIISKFVNEHRERFDPANECEDLIDAFLLEQHKLKAQKAKDHSFVDFQLIRLISELFIAGIETTSTALTWTLLILSKFPQVQRKMHDEIIEVIGSNRLPTMTDKKSLHYFQAVQDEILRFVTPLPLALPHKVFNDTSVNGYFIPGNTIIFANLYACHRDHSIWEKPFDFYPEHFLDSDGRYNPRPELVPFGIGKRICLGEGTAKIEMFIFLAMILQKFKFTLDEVSNEIETSTLMEGTGGTVRGAIHHEIIFKEINVDD